MARKNVDPIVGLSSDDKRLVQKSLPLLSLWSSDLTLLEFKILDLYLSRIDSHHPERRVVIFDRGDMERLFGVNRIRNQELIDHLTHLMSTVVKIKDEDYADGVQLVTLFETAKVTKDSHGFSKVKLEVTQKAKKYFFNVDNLGYLRYKLHCITLLTSRYAYVMFLYIEQNRFRKSWDEDLDNLKIILKCNNEETYKSYMRLNDLILKKVHAELTKKTECRYTYTAVKQGRTVVKIHFEVEPLPDKIENLVPDQLAIEPEKAAEPTELWQQPLSPWNLTAEQYDELLSLIVTLPEDCLPAQEICGGNLELMRYHYIDQKVREIESRSKQHPIKRKYPYLLKMIKQDLKA